MELKRPMIQLGGKYCTIFSPSLEYPTELAALIKICLNEISSKVYIGKYLSDAFPIQNGLKRRSCLLPLLPNSALEYVIRKVQENQVGLKSNGSNQLLVYADDVYLLGDNIDNIKQKTETLINDTSKEVGLEEDNEKTNYMLLSSPECRATSQ
jgi:hypothetical protein